MITVRENFIFWKKYNFKKILDFQWNSFYCTRKSNFGTVFKALFYVSDERFFGFFRVFSNVNATSLKNVNANNW